MTASWKRLFGIVLISALLLLAGCAGVQPPGKKHILVTFYPLLDITKEIAGPDANVESLIPAGVEAHEYEPTVSAIRKIDNALVFVRIGLEWAPLEERILQNADTPTIMASDNVALLHASEEGGAIDPHIWLSPKEMMTVARNIADGLKKDDPANAARYEQNLLQVDSKLLALDDEYQSGLASCAKDTIIVSHLAFSYVANDYGFKQVGLAGLSPQSEPSPGVIANLIGIAREKDLHAVLYEELVDPRVSETLAREVGAKALVINHIDVQKPGKDYYDQMRENLDTLRIALECR